VVAAGRAGRAVPLRREVPHSLFSAYAWKHAFSSCTWTSIILNWCCFYYFVRNILVVLLEALCGRIVFFRFVNIGFSWVLHFSCLCVCGLCPLTKALLPLLSEKVSWISPNIWRHWHCNLHNLAHISIYTRTAWSWVVGLTYKRGGSGPEGKTEVSLVGVEGQRNERCKTGGGEVYSLQIFFFLRINTWLLWLKPFSCT